MPNRDWLLRVIGCRLRVSARSGGDGEADEPPAVEGHEVDGLRGHELGRHGEVALVLAVLVVADDDHPAGLDLLQRLLDRGKMCAFSLMYDLLAIPALSRSWP